MRREVRTTRRFKFDVVRADGSVRTIEQYAEDEEAAKTRVRAFAAVHWPGSRLSGDPAWKSISRREGGS